MRMLHVEVCSLKDLDRSVWDREMSDQSYSTYAQTSYFADFREAVSDYTESIFIRVKKGEKGVGWLLMLKQFPYELVLDRAGRLKKLFSVSAKLLQTYSWPSGPLYSGSENAREVFNSLLDTVDSLARQSGIYMVRQILPAYLPADPGWKELDEVFVSHGYESRPKATVILKVRDMKVDHLWERLKKDTRRAVRKARNQRVSVVEATTEKEVDAYYNIRKETARRNRLRFPSREYFQAILRSFPRDVYKIFLSEHEGHWVSGQGVAVFNGNLILEGVCYSDYSKENSIYGNDLVQWHIIEWACSQGANMVDWVGYFTQPQTKHEEGINSYKLKWGGEVVEYPEYFKVFSPVKFRLVDLARRVFSGGN